jgi:hypothetical protein
MPHFFNEVSVLEYTPHNTSKSINYLFSDSRILVIDPRKNNLSDINDNEFNVSMSINYFQYSPDYLTHLENLCRVSSKFIMFSCAAAGKSIKSPPEYYKNLVMSDFYNHLDLGLMFETYRFDVDYDRSELYFWGTKRSDSEV